MTLIPSDAGVERPVPVLGEVVSGGTLPIMFVRIENKVRSKGASK